MATEEYSIRVSVDSTDATRAERNLNNLTSSATQTERALNSTSSAARSSAAALAGVNGSASASTRSMLSLANAAKLAATSFAAISFKNAISEIATFETRMLQLTALTGASTAQMKEMEKQARELGATTAFSAQQAAEAQGVLASAGLKTNEILTATPKVLQLAAAGSLDLSKAAEISTGTMKGLGLQLSDLGRINDVFAKAAADSSTNVQQIGDAMGQIAPIAKTYGIGLETLTASLGILADNQIKGSEAGNNFKSMLVALSNDTKDNVEILKKHGVTYSQLNVEVYGLTKVMQTLKNAHLSGAESLKIFGSDAAAAGNILAANAGKISDYTKELEKADGTAKKVSDTLNQGLAKAFDSLKGTLSEAALQLGDSGLKGALTGVIQQATGVISIYEGMGDKFAESNNLTKEQYTNLKDIADELKIVAGAAGGIAGLTAAIWAANAAMTAFNIATRSNPLIMGATVVAATAGAALTKAKQNIEKADNQLKISANLDDQNKKIKEQTELLERMKAYPLTEKGQIQEAEQRLEIMTKQKTILEQTSAPIIQATEKTEKHTEATKANASAIADKSNETKKLTAEQKQANKEQTEYQRLIESTPYGAYNATIDKLTEGLKRGGEAFRATYATGVEEANKKLLYSTEYVKEHTKALEEQKRALEGTARGTFEKGYSELMTQKPYMSDTEYSAKQDKLTADYLTQQQGKDYKTPAEQAKDATSAYDDLNKKLQETATAFDSVGNSSKMAFDGLLGGVSAVAGAMSSFSGEMAQLNDNFQKGSAAYSDFMLKEGTTFEQREKATADYYSMKDKYDSASFKAEISGARQIAGATSKLFGEKSAARKAFHGVEMALSVVEMAMSAKKMIVDVAAGAARMFSQGGFAGFAGVAAMAAVMGGLGFAMMGGGDKVTDLTTPETSTTGSVLGSNEASSSIKNIVDTLNSIHASEYVELQDLNANFKDLVQQTTKGTALALQDRGAFAWSTNAMKGGNTGASEKQFMMGLGTTAISAGLAAAGTGVGLATSVLAGAINASVALTGAASTVTSALVGTSAALMSGGLAAAAAMGGIGLLVGGAIYGLSKLLGIGKVKYEAVGGGIVMNAQKFMLDGMQQQVTVFDYSKVKKTVTGWFSDDVTYFDVINRIDNPLTKLFTGIFANVESTLLQASTNIFKDSDLLNTDITLPKIKLALKSGEKYTAENQKKIEDAINKASDDIASQAFGRYLGQFQSMGEGLYETTIRLASQATVATAGMEKLGSKTSLTGLGLISFSDSMTRAFGGLKEFKAGLDSLYDAFTSDPQKLIDSKKAVNDFLVSLNAPTSAGLPTEITSKSDAAKVTDYLLTTAKNISAVVEPLLKTNNLQPDTTGMQELWNKVAKFEFMPKANKAYIKNIPVENLTTDILTKALEGTRYTLESLKATKPLIEYAKNNANYLDSKKQLNELKTNKVLNEELKKLGFEMPKTVVQAATLAEKLKELEDKATGNVDKFDGLTKATLNVITSLEKLADAGKFITDFSKSISAWIKNIRATSMGSPESQLNMAKANFEEQLKLAKFGATAEEKRTALSGITGYADTYMNAIKSYYATSETGQTALEDVLSQVSGLGQSVDVQELQLGALNDIKDAIDFSTIEIPKGISEANQELWNKLITATKSAGDVAKLNPTLENTMRYDALAKIVLMIDKSAGMAGVDAAFMDKLIQSVAGEGGLTSNVNLIINSAEFDAAQKTAIINNVLASFNEQVLTLKNFSFDMKDAVDAAKTSVLQSWGEPKLDVTTDDAIKKIAEIDKLSKELNSLITTENGVTVLSDDAKAKIAEIDAKSKELNALISQNNLLNVLPDDAKLKLADVAKASSELNSLIAKDNSVNILDDVAIQKIKTLTTAAKDLNLMVSKENFMSVDSNQAIKNMLEVRYLNTNLELGITAEKALNVNTAKATTDVSVVNALAVDVNKNLATVVTMDVNTAPIIGKIDGIIVAANSATAALSAMTVENNNTIASANAAIAASNAAKAASDAAANQAAESAKAASALMTLSQADMDSLSKQTALPISAENAKYWQQQSNLNLLQSPSTFTPAWKLAGFNSQNDYDTYYEQTDYPKFANGGIANQASIFGEAGAEAAVPLPDGRSIPVTLYNASNDSSVNSAETIAELKSQNQKLEILVNTMMATSKAEREKTQELIDAMNGLRTDTRLKNKA